MSLLSVFRKIFSRTLQISGTGHMHSVLRGHGESDFVAGHCGSFDEHMEDIASVISSLDQPPILVAHSLGGLMAQR